ncbi:MAG TPA: putative glycoside hydrolase, partial [Luteimonas sp.]|nr:putative glycoside hydrolase [Luteimonas sp.]
QPAATTGDGSLEMSAINHEVQEGARLFAWSGPATVQVLSGESLDVTRETNGDVPVVLTLRVDALPASGNASLLASCGEGCSGEIEIGQALATLPRGEWTRLAVPLKCLRLRGADVSRLDVPFQLRADAGATIALARVAVSTEFDHQVACPTN